MESQAKFKFVKGSPRKIRILADMVRGKRVQEALDILHFQRKAHAIDMSKLIRSALANALQKGGVRTDSLVVKKICVDQALIMKRISPRARGSASSIHKKMSHLSVTLESNVK